ncbi:MAG: hypothetical protein PHF84_11030 [bacterium]|nr:hypothetical protein [bacterium]
MEIDKLNSILLQLEGVYKVTLDSKQKERVRKDIDKVKKQIEHEMKYGEKNVLKENEPEAGVEVKTEGSPPANETDRLIQQSAVLSKFPITNIHPLLINEEINAAIFYLQIFENELWGPLSDFHLKLDYFYSHEREKFYNKSEVVKRLIKQYFDVLDELSNLEINNVYSEKLKIMKNKQERVILIEGVKFISEIDIFIEQLINDYEGSQNTILNPNDAINFSDIEGKRFLDGWVVIEALRFISKFCKEFMEIIKIPEEILRFEK